MIIGINGKIGAGKDTVGAIIQYLTAYTWAQYTHPMTNEDFISYLENRQHLKSIWKIKKFATKLKEIICMLTGCTMEQLENQKFKDSLLPEEWQVYHVYNFDKPVGNLTVATEADVKALCAAKSNSQHKFHYVKSARTYRWMLQFIGTDLFRERLHSNAHVNMLFADYKEGMISYVKNPTQLRAVSQDIPDRWIITDMRFRNEADAIDARGGIKIKVERPLRLRYPLEYQEYLQANPSGLGGFMDWAFNYKKELYDKLMHPSETSLDGEHKGYYVLDNSQDYAYLIQQVKTILSTEHLI